MTDNFNEPCLDKGPWSVVHFPERGTTYLYSDDFEHDAKLQIFGDFGSYADKQMYAQALADALNKAAESARVKAAIGEIIYLQGSESGTND